MDYKYYNFAAHRINKNIIEIFIDCPHCYDHYYQLHIRDFCATIVVPSENNKNTYIIDADLTKDYTDYMAKHFAGYKPALREHKRKISEQER